jgi:hypothetical protein
MLRVRLIVVTLLPVLAVAGVGCGKDEPTSAPPVTTPRTTGGSPSASATPTASPANVVEFSVDGAGPYQLGANLPELQAANLLAEVTKGTPECPQNTTARGTGAWTDVHLSFRSDNRLYLLVNRSATVPTPSGAWLGTSLTELRRIYVGIPNQELRRGADSAFLVTTLSGRGILFELDPSKRITAMSAGEAAFLRSSYQGGTAFC